jgi:hypothetical protein
LKLPSDLEGDEEDEEEGLFPEDEEGSFPEDYDKDDDEN